MNILLSYPEFTNTFLSFKHALKLAHNKVSSSPSELLSIAAMLPAQWHKRLIGLNVCKLTAKGKQWAGAVSVSGTLVQREACGLISV